MVGDITYLRVADRFLYLATVVDLHSRRLVGWSLATHARAELACGALQAAVVTRGGDVGGVIFHTGVPELHLSKTSFSSAHAIRPIELLGVVTRIPPGGGRGRGISDVSHDSGEQSARSVRAAAKVLRDRDGHLARVAGDGM